MSHDAGVSRFHSPMSILGSPQGSGRQRAIIQAALLCVPHRQSELSVRCLRSADASGVRAHVQRSLRSHHALRTWSLLPAGRRPHCSCRHHFHVSRNTQSGLRKAWSRVLYKQVVTLLTKKSSPFSGPEGHYCTCRSPRLNLLLRYMNSFHTLTIYFLKTHLILSFNLLRLGTQSNIFSSGFPTEVPHLDVLIISSSSMWWI
jgi:hypothetical protein